MIGDVLSLLFQSNGTRMQFHNHVCHIFFLYCQLSFRFLWFGIYRLFLLLIHTGEFTLTHWLMVSIRYHRSISVSIWGCINTHSIDPGIRDRRPRGHQCCWKQKLLFLDSCVIPHQLINMGWTELSGLTQFIFFSQNPSSHIGILLDRTSSCQQEGDSVLTTAKWFSWLVMFWYARDTELWYPAQCHLSFFYWIRMRH